MKHLHDQKPLVSRNLKYALLVCCMAYFNMVSANTYTPNTFTDPVISSINNATGAINGGATISLRSALMAADNMGLTGGPHIVTLSSGTYNLTQAIPNRQITIGNTSQNITINGNGPANTIINNTLDGNKDRILFINPSGTTNSPVITINGVKFQNAYLSSDPYGGAAVCAGGGSAESLTLNNCAFDNNVIPANSYGGAAVCLQVRGNLTIDNCTFTNNVSNDADGGAVLFIVFGSTLGTGYGTLSVTNSTFNNNSVIFPGAPTSNGGALAFTGQAGCTPFNATINNNTFTNNTADGLGGAISANNSPNVSIPQIHYNRFSNNTSTTNAITSGMLFVNSAGSVNAENNWWGCNGNPVGASSTSPCNQVNGIGSSGGGSLDANPWLQLRTTAASDPICNTAAGLGNTNLITASFLKNSDGTTMTLANLSRLIGLTVNWGPTVLGSLSGQQTTIQASGTATATFTSNGTGGTATVNAQVDNVSSGETSPSRASFTVNTIPIVSNPANFTSCVTGTATFSSTITGTPTPTISWRKGGIALVNGVQASGSTVSGQGTGTLTITNVQPGDAATTYDVVASNHCGTVPSSTATLFVNQVTGGTVGSDQTICSGGDPVLFTESVASTGSGALTYQWQSSTTSCATGFNNIGSATAATYDPPSGLTLTTYYRRVTTSTQNTIPCTANSNCITVTINNVTGGSVGSDQTICSGGDPALFTQSVASTGSGALTYQWQSSTTSCAAGFSDIGSATATTYDPPSGLTVTTYYRRVTTSTLTGTPCTANSNCITVTINDVTGGTVGSDATVCSGNDPAAFTQSIASTGTALTYKWQSSTTDCTSGFSDILPAATGITYDPPAGLLVTTYYRRVTTSTLNGIPCTANSNCITLTVNPVIVVTNPGVTTGTNGTAFSQTFTQANAIGGATFTLNSGSLPNGLSLSTTGVLDGTPSAPAGNYPVTVKVTDGNSCIAVGPTYNLVISCQSMSVTNPVITSGLVGVPFSETFTQSGGIGTVIFTSASALPTGLSLSSAGVLSGTPGIPGGTFPIVVKATDANGCFANGATYNLEIIANISPVYTAGASTNLTVCQNTSNTSIDSLLKVTDPDNGQTLTWSVVSGPDHGSVSGFPTTASTPANNLAPTGLSYSTSGYFGSDALVVQVSDGIATGQITIDINVQQLHTYYYDGDGDGYHGNTQVACVIPPGPEWSPSTIGLDCDDADGAATVLKTWYLDADGDGYSAGDSVSCNSPGTGYVLTTNGSDCNDNSIFINSPISWFFDYDNDGYYGSTQSSCFSPGAGWLDITSGPDCNDSVAAINPLATEVCNGVDDNCDAAIDEGFTQYAWYLDADGDGYSLDATPVNACSSPGTGYTQTPFVFGDCNDNNDSIHFGAIELCNGVDDDCDTQIDNGAGIEWYYDGDNDGYYVGPSLFQCPNPGPGYRTDTLGADCNDSVAGIHPNGAPYGTGVTGITSHVATFYWIDGSCGTVLLYQTRLRKTGATKWSLVGVTPPDNKKNLVNLVESTNYEVQVRAWFSATDSSDWTPLTFFQTLDPCEAPTADTARNIKSTSVIVAWIGGTTAKHNIQYRKVGTSVWTTESSQPGKTQKLITGLTASTQYEYRMRTICGTNDKSVFTAKKQFTTLSTVRLAQEEVLEEINDLTFTAKVVPNPNNGVFMVEGESCCADKVQVIITNLLGQVVYSFNETIGDGIFRLNIAVSDIEAGTYFLGIKGEKVDKTLSFIKQ